jgi:hypothetical protein
MSKVAKKPSTQKNDSLTKLRDLTKELASTEIEHNSDAINEIKKLVMALAERVSTSTSSQNENKYNKLELVFNKH